jgi:hypothetical protein
MMKTSTRHSALGGNSNQQSRLFAIQTSRGESSTLVGCEAVVASLQLNVYPQRDGVVRTHEADSERAYAPTSPLSHLKGGMRFRVAWHQ